MTYLRDLTEQYNKGGHKLPGASKKIHVDVVQMNSGPMSDNLIAKVKDGVEFPNGVPAPQIVSPSVDTWLTRVNFITGQQVFDIGNTKPLALTPCSSRPSASMAQSASSSYLSRSTTSSGCAMD